MQYLSQAADSRGAEQVWGTERDTRLHVVLFKVPIADEHPRALVSPLRPQVPRDAVVEEQEDVQDHGQRCEARPNERGLLLVPCFLPGRGDGREHRNDGIIGHARRMAHPTGTLLRHLDLHCAGLGKSRVKGKGYTLPYTCLGKRGICSIRLPRASLSSLLLRSMFSPLLGSVPLPHYRTRPNPGQWRKWADRRGGETDRRLGRQAGRRLDQIAG